MKFILWIIALGALCTASPTQAQVLQYEIVGYGSKHVVLMLRGNVPLGLNSSMSADGLAARISGVGIQFAPRTTAALPALVSSVQQVKRGPTTDLVVNLNEPCELSLGSASGGVRLVIKSRREAAASQSAQATAVPPVNNAQIKLPFRITTGPANQKQSSGLTIALPESKALNITAVAAALRACAYSIDLFCSILGCGTLPMPRNPNLETGSSEPAPSSSEGDKLIASLSAELEQLRAELAAKNKELEQIQGSAQ